MEVTMQEFEELLIEVAKRNEKRKLVEKQKQVQEAKENEKELNLYSRV